MVTNTTTIVRYQISGNTYAITFGYWAKSNIEVYLTLADGSLQRLTLGTDYTLTDPNGISGTLTKVSDWGTATKITIRRIVPLTQEKDLVNGQTIDAEILEDAHDLAVAGLQQLAEGESRSIMIPLDEAGTNVILPDKETRKGTGEGTMLGFDSTGNAMIVRDLAQFDDDVQETRDNATAAAGSATAAANSAFAANISAQEASEEADVATAMAGAAEASKDQAATYASTAQSQAATATTQAQLATAKATEASSSASQAAASALNAATSASAAEAAQEAIEDMTVSSQTLNPGSPATVTKTTIAGVVNLAFGIPKGLKGDKGEMGQGITVKSSAAECTQLGDAYIGTDGHLYILVALPSTFQDAGEVKGPQGDSGVYLGESAPTDPLKNIWINTTAEDQHLLINAYVQTGKLVITKDDGSVVEYDAFNSAKYATDIRMSMNATTGLLTTYLVDQDGTLLGTAKTVSIPIESLVVSGHYDATTRKIILTLRGGSTIEFSVSDLVQGLVSESTFLTHTGDTVAHTTAVQKAAWDAKYNKPSGGIPATDLAEEYYTESEVDALIANKLGAGVITTVYDTTSTYSVGDFVLKGGVLYECNTDIDPAEAWTPAHWTETKTMNKVKNKVDKVTGKGLSTNDYDNTEKGIVADANTHMANTNNPHTVTAEQVGLGNCDNTSDLDKPISTLTQAALDLKLTTPENGEAGQTIVKTASGTTWEYKAPTRQNEKAYVVGDKVIFPNTLYALKCQTAGTSGSSIPVLPATIESGVTQLSDGTVVWIIYDLTYIQTQNTDFVPTSLVMPPDSTLNSKIVQYTGADTSDYKKGAFYERIKTSNAYVTANCTLTAGGTALTLYCAYPKPTGTETKRAYTDSALTQATEYYIHATILYKDSEGTIIDAGTVDSMTETPDGYTWLPNNGFFYHHNADTTSHPDIRNNVYTKTEISSLFQSFYDGIYPVNSIHFGLTAPSVPNGVTATWVDISANYNGRYFKASTQNIGTFESEQLPDVQGVYTGIAVKETSWCGDGPFISNAWSSWHGITWKSVADAVDVYGTNIFKLSNGNPIYVPYGAVRPLTTTIKVWQRTV